MTNNLLLMLMREDGVHIAPGELASLDVCTIKTGCGIEVWGYRTL